MNDTFDSYTAGFNAGKALLEPGPSLNAALAKADEQLAGRRLPASLQVTATRNRLQRVSERVATAERTEAAARAKRDELQRQAEEHPARFSPRRGIVYLVISLLMLGAEFALLSQILAEVLHLPVLAESSDGKAVTPLGVVLGLLVSQDFAAARGILDLLVATAGLLGLPILFKAVADSRSPSEKKVSGWRGWGIFHIIAAIALVTLVMAALARLYVDFSAEGVATEPVAPLVLWTSVLIGIACPLGGFLLFTSGIEAWGGSRRLRSALKTARDEADALQALRDEQIKLETEHEHAVIDQAHAGTSEQLESMRSGTVEEFRRGFSVGLDVVLGSAGERGGYRRIRAILAAANATTPSLPIGIENHA